MEKINLHRSIIIIDKPIGPTSFQVTDFVRKQLGLNKASHFGTLDPKVTGVLPIALGRASRLTSYFSKQDKEYVGIMHLHEDVDEKKLNETIKEFTGKIKQLPPKKSRVKREERVREIKKFEILEKQEKDVLFIVECEAGTYIRKLIHDLGISLGVGAHMTELRRIRASIFPESESVNLYDFSEAVKEFKKGNDNELGKMLIPIEITSKIMPSVQIHAEYIERLKHGSPLFKKMIKKHEDFRKDDFVAVFVEEKLLEICRADTDSKNLKSLSDNDLIAKPSTVFQLD